MPLLKDSDLLPSPPSASDALEQGIAFIDDLVRQGLVTDRAKALEQLRASVEALAERRAKRPMLEWSDETKAKLMDITAKRDAN